MRYLTLAEAFIIAEDVTGIDTHVLVAASRSDLLDSALHAPQAGFGDTDFYPSIHSKAAVLCHRIAKNHPLPDGNKRLAWVCLVVFLELNGWSLHVPDDDAVTLCCPLLPARPTSAVSPSGWKQGLSRTLRVTSAATRIGSPSEGEAVHVRFAGDESHALIQAIRGLARGT